LNEQVAVVPVWVILDVISRGCKPFLVRSTPNNDRKFRALVSVAKCQLFLIADWFQLCDEIGEP
jgi:hypothetical protein